MSYKLATAYVDVEARMGKMESQIGGIKSRLGSMLAGIGSLAGALGLGLSVGAAVSAARSFIASATEAYESESRLRAVIVATGKAAGFAAEDILKMSEAMMHSTTFGDDQITDAASKLLTFKKVVGDTFERALKLSADLSAVGFGSIQGASVQLGKALEDPVRGIGALRRAGVSFTAEEKAKIKTLVESNRLLEAQTMILDAVAGQVGGVAEAMAKTPAGQWKQINTLIGEVGEEFGKRLLPLAVSLGRIFLSIAEGVLKMWDSVIRLGVAIRDQVWGALQPLIQWFSGATGIDLSWLKDGLTGAITGAIEAFYEFQADTFEWIQVFVQNVSAGMEFLKTGFTFVMSYLFELIRNNAAYVWGFFFGAASKAAFDFIAWLGNALVKMSMTFATAMVTVIGQIPGWIHDALMGTAPMMAQFTAALVKASRDSLAETQFQLGKASRGFQEGFAGGKMDLDLGMGEANRKRLEDLQGIFEKLQGAKDELEKTRGDMWKLPAGPEIKPLKAEVEQKMAVKLEIPAGLSGLTEAWTTLQNAMLKQATPEEKMAAGIEGIEGLNEKMLEEMAKLNNDGVKLAGVAVA